MLIAAIDQWGMCIDGSDSKGESDVSDSQQQRKQGEVATIEEEATDRAIRAAATIEEVWTRLGNNDRIGLQRREGSRVAAVVGTDGGWKIVAESKGRNRAAAARGWSNGRGGIAMTDGERQ
ncbi:hypothetical protein BHE74_00009276 [Ensete ventricosum]|nr:hypothetical protein BHE74_00009276 [Ensete ventricosum]